MANLSFVRPPLSPFEPVMIPSGEPPDSKSGHHRYCGNDSVNVQNL